jgi:hypothetical protein
VPASRTRRSADTAIKPAGRHLRRTIDTLLDANVPFVLWGPPGVGKTRVVEALAADRGWHCETVLGSIREPQDIAGFPAITPDGSFSLLAPDYVQRIVAAVERAGDAPGGAVLFLDEVSNCAPPQQAALLRVGTDRMIGDTRLPASCRIVFAANPPEQAADGWELSAPLANRLVHLDFPAPEAADWAAGLLRNWGRPADHDADHEARLVAARAAVAGFVAARPHLLHQLPDEAAAAGRAWPSPRSWADLVVPGLATAAVISDGETRAAVEQVVLNGAVGAGAAWEFVAWYSDRDLPDPAHLLNYPGDFVPPERPDRVHAVLASVVGAAIASGEAEPWAAAWVILGAAVKAKFSEIAAVSARALLESWPDGAERPAELGAFRAMLRRTGLTPRVEVAGSVRAATAATAGDTGADR